MTFHWPIQRDFTGAVAETRGSVDSAGGACYTGVREGWQATPTISKFYGLVIRMYYDDKHVPHFHVGYAEYRALIAVEDGSIIAGRLPLRAYRMAVEWAELHRAELMANWERARRQETLEWIDGLE